MKKYLKRLNKPWQPHILLKESPAIPHSSLDELEKKKTAGERMKFVEERDLEDINFK